MHTYTLRSSIFDGPTTNLLSTPCILIDILSCAELCEGGEEEKNINNFKMDTFSGRFNSDSAASMAVKGLKGHRPFAEAGNKTNHLPASSGNKTVSCQSSVNWKEALPIWEIDKPILPCAFTRPASL